MAISRRAPLGAPASPHLGPSNAADMPACTIPPADKARLGRERGSHLAKRYGKKRFYSPGEVRTSLLHRAVVVDWHCWGYALFCTAEAFADGNRGTGETCDYAVMKAEMVSAVTDGATQEWFTFDLSWLDWPDINLGSLFAF